MLLLAAAAPPCSQAAAGNAGAAPELAGSASVAEGLVTALGANGATRSLQDGSPIYAGDTISTGHNSYASLEFEDEGEIVLRPDTQFAVQRFHFDPDAHDGSGAGADPAASDTAAQPESAFFSLLKGGLRAVSGLIGHIHQDDYQMSTPTATIGIRGTQYDVRYCRNDCGDETDASGIPTNGVYTSVLQGAVQMRNDTGTTLVTQGHHVQAGARNRPFMPLARLPNALRHMALPQRLQSRAQVMRGRIHQQRQQRRIQHVMQRNARRQLQGGNRYQAKPGTIQSNKAGLSNKAGAQGYRQAQVQPKQKAQTRAQTAVVPRTQQQYSKPAVQAKPVQKCRMVQGKIVCSH